MKLLKTIEIENIKTNSKAKLDGLNDFNIIIGPNNCGKTSILKTILSVQDVSSEPSLTCTKCQDIANSVAAKGIQLKYDISDLYLGGMDTQRQPYYKLSFYHEVAKKLFEECYAKFSEINMDDEQKPDTHLSGDLIFTGDIHKFRLEHLSPFIFKGGFAKLQSSIFYCPESRLQTYKDMPMQAYIRDKRLRGNVLSKWVNFISSIVDSKVEDFTGDLDLV